MIGLSAQHRYYLYDGAADMRKGFDGLSGLVTNYMQRDPLDGSVYLFINRRRDRLKMLVYEQGGFMLYYKRLERGTFEIIKHNGSDPIAITWEDLVLLIQGIKLSSVKRLKRHVKSTSKLVDNT